MRYRPPLLAGLQARLLAALVVLGGVAALAVPARAELLIIVDKSTQTMTVSEDGAVLHTWPVSTGVARYDTPSGAFKPFRMEKDHFSREWDDAPMPYSMFFTMQGHAIHGTNHRIDGAAHSHGCVRLSVAHAAALWALVKQNKMANTRVVLTGDVRDATPAVARRNRDDTDFDQSFADDDMTGTLPPPRDSRRRRVVRGWRESDDGEVYYYERLRRPRPEPLPPPGFLFFGWR